MIELHREPLNHVLIQRLRTKSEFGVNQQHHDRQGFVMEMIE